MTAKFCPFLMSATHEPADGFPHERYAAAFVLDDYEGTPSGDRAERQMRCLGDRCAWYVDGRCAVVRAPDRDRDDGDLRRRLRAVLRDKCESDDEDEVVKVVAALWSDSWALGRIARAFGFEPGGDDADSRLRFRIRTVRRARSLAWLRRELRAVLGLDVAADDYEISRAVEELRAASAALDEVACLLSVSFDAPGRTPDAVRRLQRQRDELRADVRELVRERDELRAVLGLDDATDDYEIFRAVEELKADSAALGEIGHALGLADDDWSLAAPRAVRELVRERDELRGEVERLRRFVVALYGDGTAAPTGGAR